LETGSFTSGVSGWKLFKWFWGYGGYPFEYYMVRFFYHEKREIESGRPLPAD